MANLESTTDTNTNTDMQTYTKINVKEHEYKMHKHVYDLHIVNTPKIISYDKKTETMVMEKINNMNLSDMYGEKDSDLDEYYFDEIRTIIKTLAAHHIEYPDIQVIILLNMILKYGSLILNTPVFLRNL